MIVLPAGKRARPGSIKHRVTEHLTSPPDETPTTPLLADKRREPIPVLNKVQAKYSELFKQSARDISQQIKDEANQIESLQNEASLLTHRWERRRRLDVLAEATRRSKERTALSNKITEIDERAKPFLRNLGKYKMGTKEAERALRAATFASTKRSSPIELKIEPAGDKCEDCGIRMCVIANDSLLGCPKCAKSKEISVSLAPSAESEYIASSNTQKSRLVEWLEFCQAKEYTEPTKTMVRDVSSLIVEQKLSGLENHIKNIQIERANHGPFTSASDAIARLKHEIPNIEHLLLNLNGVFTRNVMQSTAEDKIRKSYEHAPKIAARISGYWPPRFSFAQEETIRHMFTIAAPFYERNRKAAQPHWPGGYAYFLRCVCTLLGWDEFVDHFPVVKSTRTAQMRDAQRKIIWAQLGWEFIPSEAGLHRPLLITSLSL